MISNWIMSEGGPLVVLDRSLKVGWGGIFRLTMPDLEASNDYDRACRVRSYLALIPVEGGISFVIGDIPMDSCFWYSGSNDFAIAQVCFCAADFDANKTMDSFTQEIEKLVPEQSIEFEFGGGSLVMFDSSDGGDRQPEEASIYLPLGLYTISTYIFEPDSETSMVIHAFKRR